VAVTAGTVCSRTTAAAATAAAAAAAAAAGVSSSTQHLASTSTHRSGSSTSLPQQHKRPAAYLHVNVDHQVKVILLAAVLQVGIQG
jgi:hypothetical protein